MCSWHKQPMAQTAAAGRPKWQVRKGNLTMERGIFQVDRAEELFNHLKHANTEAAKKERFIQYLSLTFAKDRRAQALISEMSLGAEKTVANILRGHTSGRGRADTQTDTIIIEWE